MRRTLALILLASVLMAFVFSVFAAETDSASVRPDEPQVLPQDVYPDADMIISIDSKNNTLVTFKAYGDYVVTKDHPSEWFTVTYPENKDVKLRLMSTVDKDMYIVYEKATVKKLTLFEVDTKAALSAAINVRFYMVSGSIQTLSLVSIADPIKRYVGTSYDVMSSPVKNAVFDLEGGEINLYNPTSAMVSITNYVLNVSPGMTINRLFTTGENGKYSNVDVYINGPQIGYMSNIESKIGTLNYNIQSGTIEYLCIGANSEHYPTRNLANMSTSHVTGDVTIHIGSSVQVNKCIIGAGILNNPNILCNGQLLTSPIIHIVQIDAPGITVYNDTAFLTERRNQAYHFDANYRIGTSPPAYPIAETFIYKNEIMPVYGPGGVWDSMSSCTIPVGGILSLNTSFFIQSNGEFFVSKGATVYNMDDMILCGLLINEGTMVNNSVIQCRSGSDIEGKIGGTGILADYIRYSTPTSAVNVMSQKMAVVVDQGELYPVESIYAILNDSRSSVSITVGEHTRIFVNEFMIALSEREPEKDFDGMYRLEIKGINQDVLGVSTVSVTLPTDSSVCTAVYALDSSSGEYVLLGTSLYEQDVKFNAQNYNKFYLLKYTDDRPDPPSPSDQDVSVITSFDYILIAAIIAVLAVTAYSLFTMKRD